jgi:hypothetical protein
MGSASGEFVMKRVMVASAQDRGIVAAPVDPGCRFSNHRARERCDVASHEGSRIGAKRNRPHAVEHDTSGGGVSLTCQPWRRAGARARRRAAE